VTEVVLREAGLADLDAVVALFLECWQVSYAAVLPPEALARMDEAAARQLWTEAFGRPGTMLVADADGVVAGLARFSLPEPRRGYLGSLYVPPAQQGSGIGGALLRRAEQQLAEAGAESASLWVFSANAPSIGFYRAHGWEPTGEERTEEAFGEPELGLGKALAPAR
jgi:L-amino acid N-acyltransferase YncA